MEGGISYQTPNTYGSTLVTDLQDPSGCHVDLPRDLLALPIQQVAQATRRNIDHQFQSYNRSQVAYYLY